MHPSVIETIVGRPTVPPVKMGEPGPDADALARMLAAAAAAPDHGKLVPWRYLILRGEGRVRLGELFAAGVVAANPGATAAEVEKQRSAPSRAPLILVAIAHLTPDHAKIPEVEQMAAAAASVQNLLLAAHALGFAAKWATGANAYSDVVHRGLGLCEDDRILGFIYLGSRIRHHEPSPRPPIESFTEEWPL